MIFSVLVTNIAHARAAREATALNLRALTLVGH